MMRPRVAEEPEPESTHIPPPPRPLALTYSGNVIDEDLVAINAATEELKLLLERDDTPLSPREQAAFKELVIKQMAEGIKSGDSTVFIELIKGIDEIKADTSSIQEAAGNIQETAHAIKDDTTEIKEQQAVMAKHLESMDEDSVNILKIY